MRSFLACLIALAVPAPALAAPVVKLACTSQGRPLPRKGKVPGTLDCELSARKLKGHSGALKAQLRVVTGELSSAPLEAQQEIAGDGVVFRFQLEPGAAFPACEKFDLDAEVTGAKGKLGKARLSVAQDCPKPKPGKNGKATLACTSSSPDGVTRYAYPGNGDKDRPRLVRELNCAVLLEKAPEAGPVKCTFKVGRRTREAAVREAGAGVEAGATFFPLDDFPSCEPFGVEAELTVAGSSVWKGALQVPQACPK